MTEKKYNFQKLTPIKNVDLQIYDKALNFVFSNDDIKNIAISGPYSAGKSSLIETYKCNHKEFRFLHISLAHFESSEQEDDDTKGYSEADLEGKILNQLIHQIDPDNIPQTNFKVKQKISNKSILKDTVSITIFVILTLYIIRFESWSKFVSTISQPWLKNILVNTTNSFGILLSGVLCSVLLSFAVYYIIKVQKNKNIFKKVKLQGNEIEIFEQKDESYFDKYLNEVLYLFENSDADVIVFEDIDRYNRNQIFEKLREINILINNRGKKITRFFYLLRDDIFITKDRTKFFDFIIPVVPVIDSSNSYDQFIEHFKLGGIFNLFNENFLQGLSLYVDDMRILKNIYNEFVIYYNRLQSTELNINKLLAIVVYKNIFPKDFSDLQLGMGFVHALFESKSEFIKQELKNIDLQIEKINIDIQSTEDELINSIDELDAAYLLANFQILSIAGNNVSTYSTRLQLVRAIKEKPDNVQCFQAHYGTRQMDVTFEFGKLLENSEYVKRKEVIERKNDDKLEKLKNKLQKLHFQKSVVQNSLLQEIINKENICTVFSIVFTNEIGEIIKFNEIKVSPYFPLIKYLIRNGYIDETYPDYMTYFYANSLSLDDKVFLRSVADQVSKEYSYSLKKPQLILSRLRIVDFDREEILNFDLLCYLLKTKQSNTIYLTRFLQQLSDTRNFKFIGDFLAMKRETDIFIETINNIWPGIFLFILNESNFTDEQKKQYAIYTLCFSTDSDIEAVNVNGCLSEFISSNPVFLNIKTPYIDKIISGFSLIDVKFLWIDYNVSNKELFDTVYKNNQYQLTFELISLMLEKIYNLVKSNDYRIKNYTLVSSKPDEPLAKYINDNINDYVIMIIENCNGSIEDEESSALAILNHSNVDINVKQEYINILQTIIERIDNVDNKDLWNLLLQRKLIKYSEYNILNYFFLKDQDIDPLLIQFIDSNDYDLCFSYDSINNDFGDKSASKFYAGIVKCNQLSNEKYESILQSLNRVYKSFSLKEVSNEKIEILIKIRVIQMTEDNLNFMRVNYTDKLMMFVVKNIDKYVNEVISDDNISMDEIVEVLDEDISDEYKTKLLQHTTEKISVKNKEYSDTVKLHILGHNLNVNDIQYLLITFPTESDEIKEAITRISVQYITEIITEEYSLSFELLTKLFTVSELTIEIKRQLFLLCLLHINESQAKECLLALKMKDFLNLFERKRTAKFEINSINEHILTAFKNKNWISGFEIDKNDSNYYRAFVRKAYVRKLPIEIL